MESFVPNDTRPWLVTIEERIYLTEAILLPHPAIELFMANEQDTGLLCSPYP
jgi:hypothetical protein